MDTFAVTRAITGDISKERNRLRTTKATAPVFTHNLQHISVANGLHAQEFRRLGGDVAFRTVFIATHATKPI
jgi:hypothetical protein